MKKLPDTIVERMELVAKLQKIECPWVVTRFLGKPYLFGDEICFSGTGDTDSLNLEDARLAFDWVVTQLGGKITWEIR